MSIEDTITKIMYYLREKNGNKAKKEDISSELNIKIDILENICGTKSIHLGRIQDTMGGDIHLTEKGINWIFHRESGVTHKIICHINNLSGFYTVLLAFLAFIISVISLYFSIFKT